nr:oxoglutarate/iron-dependent dioxygenase [Tanacetum cinerariifolium]
VDHADHDMYKPNHVTLANDLNQTNSSESTDLLSGINLKKKDLKTLGPGMVLLKNYISISGQVEIVKTCQEFGKGPGGFYQPALLNLRLMCFGRNWDPQTKYNARYRRDGSEAPPIPDKLVSLVQTSIKDSQTYDSSIPSMNPDICIVNFYLTSGRLGLHKDIDESPDSLNKGLPVVSISIGDSAKFLYGRYRDERKANEVLLKSGDVLIFGGRSRRIFHGVKTIIP